MAYIDVQYYRETYLGVSESTDTLIRLCKRASETIDILTGYRVTQMNIIKLAPFVQEQIKKATAAQVEYLIVNGESNGMGSSQLGQVTAGNFSYGDKAGKEDISRSGMMTSQLVISLLEPTGLLYRGVGSYD